MQKTMVSGSIIKPLNRKPSKKEFKKYSFVYLLMLPSVVLTFIFAYLPMPGILAAFKDFNIFIGLLKSPWVGLTHIKEIFEIPMLYGSIINTVKLSILTIIVGFPAPIIFALMLNELKNGLFKRTSQTLSYLPHFLSWIAVVGLAQSFFDIYGPLNDFVMFLFGQETERYMFLADQKLFLPMLLLLAVWKELGWGTIIYLAAFTSIDPALYEAANIDGASRLKQHIHITIPGIKTTAVIMLIFALGNLFGSNFELVYGMQNAYINFDVISTVVFSSGIQRGEISMAAALGFLQGLVAFMLTFFANKISRKVAQISIW